MNVLFDNIYMKQMKIKKACTNITTFSTRSITESNLIHFKPSGPEFLPFFICRTNQMKLVIK